MHTFQSTHPTRECDHSRCHVADARRHFNPRTLQESATIGLIRITRVINYFNPRTLQESATKQAVRCIPLCTHFNPRTLQESATIAVATWLTHVDISIHAPYKRVRRCWLSTAYCLEGFQSTHPTRECDSGQQRLCVCPKISIHAPYKRVRPSSTK